MIITSKNLFLLRLAIILILPFNPLEGNAEQLDENCVVNVLNRTVQVQSDGSWTMPNVPSNMGQIRARVTCTHDASTTIGQTDYFNVLTAGSLRREILSSVVQMLCRNRLAYHLPDRFF